MITALALVVMWYLYRDAIVENGQDLVYYLCLANIDHSVSMLEDWATPAMHAIALNSGTDLASDPSTPQALVGYMLLFLKALPGLRSLCIASIGTNATTTCVFNLESERALKYHGTKDKDPDVEASPNIAWIPTMFTASKYELNASQLRIWQGRASTGVLTDYSLPSNVDLATFISCSTPTDTSQALNLVACGAIASPTSMSYAQQVTNAPWYASAACVDNAALSAGYQAQKPTWLSKKNCSDTGISWEVDIDSSKPRPASSHSINPLFSLSKPLLNSAGALLGVVSADVAVSDLTSLLSEIDIFPTSYTDLELTPEAEALRKKATMFVADQYWNAFANTDGSGPDIKYDPHNTSAVLTATPPASKYVSVSVEWLRGTEPDQNDPLRTLSYRNKMTLPFLRAREFLQKANDTALYLDPLQKEPPYPDSLRVASARKKDGLYMFSAEVTMAGGQWFLVSILLPAYVYMENVDYAENVVLGVAVTEAILCVLVIIIGVRLTTRQANEDREDEKRHQQHTKKIEEKREARERKKALQELNSDENNMYLDEDIFASDDEQEEYGVDLERSPTQFWETHALNAMLVIVFFMILSTWLYWEIVATQVSAGMAVAVADLAGNKTLREMVGVVYAPAHTLNTLNVLSQYGPLDDSLLAANETWDRIVYQHMLVNSPLPQSQVVKKAPLGNDHMFVGAQVMLNDTDPTFPNGHQWDPLLPLLVMDDYSGDCYIKYAPKLNAGAKSRIGSVTRDVNTPHLYKHLGCGETFKCTDRVWYKMVEQEFYGNKSNDSSQHPGVFSHVYGFPDRQGVGLTYAEAIVDSTGHMVGVMGVDINLAHVSLHMSYTSNIASHPQHSAILLDSQNGYLLASRNLSHAPVFPEVDNGQLSDKNTLWHVKTYPPLVIYGNESASESLAETVIFLQQYNATSDLTTKTRMGLSTIHHAISPQRSYEDPIIFAANISGPQNDWVVVLALPFQDLLQVINAANLFGLINSVGFAVVLLFTVALMSNAFQKRVLKLEKNESKYEGILKEVGPDKPTLQHLEAHRKRIRRVVLEACAHNWLVERRNANLPHLSSQPVLMEEYLRHSERNAVKHIKSGGAGRNVLTICNLESLDAERAAEDRKQRIKLLTSPTGDEVSTNFRSSQSNISRSQNGGKPEGDVGDKPIKHAVKSNDRSICCIKLGDGSRWPVRFYKIQMSILYKIITNIVLIIHLSLFFYEPHTFEEMQVTGTTPAVLVVEALCILYELLDFAFIVTVSYKWNRKRNILQESKDIISDSIYFIFLVLVVFDYCLTISPAHLSFEYVLPIRPLLLVYHNKPVLDAGRNFVRTLYEARNVFMLFLMTCIIAAAMGLVLFRSYLQETKGSSYQNFIRAMVATFTYLSTGENFTDIVYPMVQVNAFYAVYFVLYCLIGSFFVLSMVIAIFQNGFTAQRQRELQQSRLLSRTGMIAAFVLLDLDGSGSLDVNELLSFMKALKPRIKALDKAWIDEFFKGMDSNKDKKIDIKEFIQGIEDDSWEGLVHFDKLRLQYWQDCRTWLQVNVFHKSWYNNLNIVIVCCNIWAVALYGTYVYPTVTRADKNLDMILVAFCSLYMIEVWTQIFATGWYEYWNWGAYHQGVEAKLIQRANRLDFVFVNISFSAMVVFYIFLSGADFTGDEDYYRFVLTLPVLRLFGLVKRTRELVFTLVSILPRFASVLALLAVVIFIFAVWGTWLFGNKFNRILQDNAPAGNFDNISSSLLTLFQMLVGEGWHELMYSGVQVSGQFTYSFYFITYVAVVTILFSNMFIGIVLDAFQKTLTEKKDQEEALRSAKERIANLNTNMRIAALKEEMQAKGLISRQTSVLVASASINGPEEDMPSPVLMPDDSRRRMASITEENSKQPKDLDIQLTVTPTNGNDGFPGAPASPSASAAPEITPLTSDTPTQP
eukprot:g58345.t1